jgi:hypothetical protein
MPPRSWRFLRISQRVSCFWGVGLRPTPIYGKFPSADLSVSRFADRLYSPFLY